MKHKLEDFIGVELVKVDMKYKTGKDVEIKTKKVKSYDYRQFDVNNVNISPVGGCDLIIEHYSIDSKKSVYEIAGVDSLDIYYFELKRYSQINSSVYCLPKHKKRAIEEMRSKVLKVKQDYINDLKTIIKTIENE